MTKTLAPSACRNSGTNRIESASRAPITKMAMSRTTRLRFSPKKLAIRESQTFRLCASLSGVGGLGSGSMAAWFWYAFVAAVLYGAHQIFTRLASERIGDGLRRFSAVTLAAVSVLLFV